MHYISQIIVAVNPLGALLGYSISISRVILGIQGTLPWWLTSEHKDLNTPTSLVWDSRLVPWIHAYDGDIQVSPIAPKVQKDSVCIG